MSFDTKMTALADAIREKTGRTDTLTLDEMTESIEDIEVGIDTSDATATSSDILSGKTAYVDGDKVTGTIATKTASNLSASGATVTVPSGYYASQVTKSVATATQATPSVSINANGLITASATQTAGYVSAGTKSGTKQLTTQSSKTITPTKSTQTAVAKNVYTTGAVTVGAIPSEYITTTDATVTATDVLSGKTAYVKGSKVTGTMKNNGAISKTMDGINTKSVTVPAGYTSGGTVSLTDDIDNEVDTQADLISQIATALENKAAGGIDTSDATAVAGDILSGKTAYVKGSKVTGTIASKGTSDLIQSGPVVVVPAGYYPNEVNKNVGVGSISDPTVTIDASGKITATSTVTQGYIASSGTKTGTKQLTTQAAKTITPSTSSQTAVAKNVYTTGAVTVAAIPSKYEDVGTETSTYTTKLASLENAIAALETELEGKASGGSDGGSSLVGEWISLASLPTTFLADPNTVPYYYEVPDNCEAVVLKWIVPENSRVIYCVTYKEDGRFAKKFLGTDIELSDADNTGTILQISTPYNPANQYILPIYNTL